MKLSISTQNISSARGELAVAVIDPKTALFDEAGAPYAQGLRRARNGFRKERFHREMIFTPDEKGPVSAVLVFSTSLSKAHDLRENVKIFAARSLGYARDYGYSKILFLLNGAGGAALAGPVAEGFVLADYRFDKYKHKNKGKPSSSKSKAVSATLLVRGEDKKAAAADLGRYALVAEQANFARDLVNEPGDKIYPKSLADAARHLARAGKLGVTIVSGTALEKSGYHGLIAVGKGSVYPPCLVVLRYRPKKTSKHHLALVGKGITFDTGGISIKPAESMWQMKGDMAGGAAVLGAMAAIAALKPKTAVTGIVAAAENFPGPRAQRPGDIFIAKNGKSVMVDNTDAEGRLVLTDALARAGEEKATHVVDAATLTGSVVRALGTSVAGIMGNDPDLVAAVIAAGAKHGERFWELPLVEEYKESLKTPYADLNNIGGRNAGSITAGLFLREFVPEGVAWAHLDIAGPFIVEKTWKYYPEGATGFAVKTFVELAESLS